MTTMQLYLSHNADYYTSVLCDNEVLLPYGIHCNVVYITAVWY